MKAYLLSVPLGVAEGVFRGMIGDRAAALTTGCAARHRSEVVKSRDRMVEESSGVRATRRRPGRQRLRVKLAMTYKRV